MGLKHKCLLTNNQFKISLFNFITIIIIVNSRCCHFIVSSHFLLNFGLTTLIIIMTKLHFLKIIIFIHLIKIILDSIISIINNLGCKKLV
jgi:hypothetical protein